MLHDAIGIDPDSLACVCTLVRRNGTKPEVLKFPLTRKGCMELVEFIGKIPDVLVGIEGLHGQNVPLEELFARTGTQYYCVPANRAESYRKAMVGTGKNNPADARAVAEFLLDLETKGQLGRFVPPPSPDTELQALARRRLYHGQHHSALVNQLWKLLKAYAGNLYLTLHGHGEEETNKTALDSKQLLSLFSAMPQIESWSELSEDRLSNLSGGRQDPGWGNFVRIIISGSRGNAKVSPSAQLLIRQTADQLLVSREQLRELDRTLGHLASDRPIVQALIERYRGMGAYTASLLIGEIITVARFPNDDHLASYAGLTRRDHSTGAVLNQVHSRAANLRLKTAFITLAREYLLHNKDSHLGRYHQHLTKRGIKPMEAIKRVARALARDVFRFIKRFEATPLQEKGEAVAMGTDSQLAPWSTGNTCLPLTRLPPAISDVKTVSTA
jgi:transposase